MTDRDESSEGFLERWSRKKIDAEQKSSDAPKADDTTPSGPAGRAAGDGAIAPATAAPKPEFDLASLPSLESITAGTDIRAFLMPGVPAEIARAALRRAWTADATIRDFVGLAENAWDFNDPAAMPGFGPLEPGYDITKAVAQLFGEVEKLTDDAALPDRPNSTQPSRLTEKKDSPALAAKTEQALAAGPEANPPIAPVENRDTPQGRLVQCDNITAPHKSNRQVAADERKTRRNHGGALPQ
jgi:hypothetical protein